MPTQLRFTSHELPAPHGAVDHLHHGDNLAVLRGALPDASVDLVYVDPPFMSGARYAMKDGQATPVFDDLWRWDDASAAELAATLEESAEQPRRVLLGLEMLLGRAPMLAYLVAMARRLVELRRVLRPQGSIYVHCDGSASHYLKVLLDGIFGPACFLNNVVWLYGLGGSSPRYWPRKHDDLLWYAREPGRQHFEPATVPALSHRMRGLQKKAPDWWSIPALNNMARERLGYPTQKPEALLERIIASSSRPGDVVLDPCCGSGTTLVVARRLGRRFIGIDLAGEAIELTLRRLGAGVAAVPDGQSIEEENDDGSRDHLFRTLRVPAQ